MGRKHRSKARKAKEKRQQRRDARRAELVRPDQYLIKRRIEASGNPAVPLEYPLDILHELWKQDAQESARRLLRGDPPLPRARWRGIDEYHHAVGWALFRVRWALQGEYGPLPGSVDRKYAKMVAPVWEPAVEAPRELTDADRERIRVAAKQDYDAMLKRLDAAGQMARRLVIEVCIDLHMPLAWLAAGDVTKWDNLQALRAGLDAMGADTLRRLDQSIQKPAAGRGTALA